MEKTKSDIIIYAAIHQPVNNNFPEYITPLQAGAALSRESLCDLKDNCGINISSKNKEFCELTALYWIWKNDRHSIISFNHYRRYFQINYNKINTLLSQYEMIIPPIYFFRQSLEEEYIRFHCKEDWELMKKVVKNMHPDLEQDMFRVFSSNRLIPYNMMISRRVLLEKYCDWLFPILFKIESEISLSNRSPYQQRALGFLAERLFTLYVYSKQLLVHIGDIVIPENRSLPLYVKYTIGKRVNNAFFRGKRWLQCKQRFQL